MTVRIDKNVPISEYYWGQYVKNGYGNVKKTTRKPKYPFVAMEIGDSFLVPERYGIGTSAGGGNKFRIVANTYGHRLGRKFVVLRDDSHKWRCWRTA